MRYRLFCLLMVAMIALGIGGCAGEGKSFDPLGTDVLTFGDTAGSVVVQLDPNATVQLTATVTDAAGKVVADREVFFGFLTNTSGGRITSTKVTTNTAGVATISYTAGVVAGVDVVRAALSNGFIMDVSITVGGGVGGTQVALAGSPTSLSAGQVSIITATVTSSAGTPLQGQTVTFTFATNSSGAAILTVNGTTDVSGKAFAVYTAGALNPTISVQDTVQARVTGVAPSADVIPITRTATKGGTGVRITSSATSLAAGQIAVITATVTDSASAPVVGQLVTFTLSADNSGAGLTTLNGTTDVSGQAVAQYTAGANRPTVSVQDTVTASITGSAAAIVITRTVGTGTGFQIGVTATPTSVAAGAVSVVTATVTNGDGTAAPGQPVSFTFFTVPSGATLSPINSGITDVRGRAIALYTAGANDPTLSVHDIILASVPGATAPLEIIRTSGTPTGFHIDVTAAPTSLAAGAVSIVTATVTNTDGTSAAGQPVTFAFIGAAAPSGATLSPINGGITDSNGRALAVYTAGGLLPTSTVQDTVIVSVTGTAAVVVITRQASSATGNRISSLTATPALLPTTDGSSTITATVVGADGVTPVPGVTVTFSLAKAGVGQIGSPAVVTNASGQANTSFTGPGGATVDFNIVQAQIPGVTGVSTVVINWQ